MSAPSPIRGAIVAANQQFMATFGRGDAAGVAELYTEDGQVLPPGSEPITGRPGIQAFWQCAMDMSGKAAKLETSEVMHLGTPSTRWYGTPWKQRVASFLDRGKYAVIWQRHAEGWKLYRNIWNTSQHP